MKFCSFFLALLTLPFAFLQAADEQENYEIIHDQAKVRVLSPTFSQRKTLKIKLKNGLEAYLISDPFTDLSGAALTVRTGSWEDPKKDPGLAHFLEHMLFLGTKKYPLESEYDRYISENGGISNAFTTNYFTSYMFSVANSAFPEALDRFSSFFKEPLFNPSGVDRELEAIDQEYAKNLEDEDIREMSVYKDLSNPEHPNHDFKMGNKASLSHVLQETLKDWYKSHYSANLMRLVVLSKLPIEKLRDMVVSDFSGVVNLNRKEYTLPLQSLSKEAKGHMVYIKPIKNVRQLTLLWELPPKFADMQDAKPDAIVCFILGHEGKESLLESLKKDRLAESIRCGGVKIGPGAMELLLEVGLTDLGVRQVDQVIGRVFQAISLLKKEGIPSYLPKEINKIETLRYQYQKRENVFSAMAKHAGWLAEESLATYPEKNFISRRYDEAAVKELIDFLTPENCIFTLKAPASLTGASFDKVEPWLKVDYSIVPISEEKLLKWQNEKPSMDINLPGPNPFLPENLSLIKPIPDNWTPDKITIPVPDRIIENDKALIYYAEDKAYYVPQVSWNIQIRTPEVDSSDPEKFALADLFIRYVKENLSTFSYDASLAGLSYDLDKKDNGITIILEGYSEKAPLLLGEIFKQLKNLQPSEQKFKLIKEVLLREYQNLAWDSPIKQASSSLKDIIYKYYTNDKKKPAALRKATFEVFEKYVNSIFAESYIEAMLYGNITKEKALELSDQMLAALASRPYPRQSQLKQESLDLPQERGPYYYESHIRPKGNAAILAIEDPSFSFKHRAAQQIIMQAIKEPFFSELRTKQQTGYIVISDAEETERKLFDIFAVQSNTHSPRDLLSRFELFIESLLQSLKTKDLPEERFKLIANSLLTSLKAPPKSMQEMSMLLNTLAFKYDATFDWVQRRIQGFNELTYEECIKYAQEILGKANRRRLAVLLEGMQPEENILYYIRVKNPEEIRKAGEYTEGAKLK